MVTDDRWPLNAPTSCADLDKGVLVEANRGPLMKRLTSSSAT